MQTNVQSYKATILDTRDVPQNIITSKTIEGIQKSHSQTYMPPTAAAPVARALSIL